MNWRMSLKTFLKLAKVALRPEFNHVLMTVPPNDTFTLLNTPIVFDQTLGDGEIRMEEGSRPVLVKPVSQPDGYADRGSSPSDGAMS